MPDFVLTLATIAWTMAAVFLVASFFDEDVTSGAAGRLLARLFAGALFVSGFFLLLLALALLRDERWDGVHYVVPMLLGAVIGVLDAALFLIPAAVWIAVPFVLIVFVFYPFRRPLERVFHPARRRTA